jgi:DNA-binding transcriptional MerR regulator
MAHDRLLIGQVAGRSGVSRKAVRLYEAVGILPPASRSSSGYRVYGEDTLALLEFITRARRLGFSLAEIKEIMAIKRSGRFPCQHVRQLVQRKVTDLDETLADLHAVRRGLHILLSSSPPRGVRAAVCPHIEGVTPNGGRRKPWKR